MSMDPVKLRTIALEWVDQIRNGSGVDDDGVIAIIATIGALKRAELLAAFTMMDEGKEAGEIATAPASPGEAGARRATELAKGIVVTREDQGPDREIKIRRIKEPERVTARVPHKRTTPGLESWPQEETTKSGRIEKIDPEGAKP